MLLHTLDVSNSYNHKKHQSLILGRLHCEWEEVCQWINIPTNNFKEWLYTTPSTDSGIETRFLTLNAHLLNEMKKLSSLQEEEKLMKRLSDYLEAVKPK